MGMCGSCDFEEWLLLFTICTDANGIGYVHCYSIFLTNYCVVLNRRPRRYSARSPDPRQPPPSPLFLPRLVAYCWSAPPLHLRSLVVRKLMWLRQGLGLARRISCVVVGPIGVRARR